ncbi:MAG TPA: vitamin K epoxide reductase family protein [Solirubrobacteraceae bacterium]|nr:vitamin K epoxide reductase family protein [Solirubrobacteraceae bacterium]
MSSHARSVSRASRLLAGGGPVTIAILVLAAIGTLEASYLTYVHYHGLGALLCLGRHAGKSSCEQVQSSVYSKLAGIPVAVLGLIGYITILATLFVRGELGRAAGFCVALIGFGFSMYLTYRELFTLHEICEWCVGSACLMTALAVLTAIRYLRAT